MAVREHARAAGIPVVMQTSDGGLLDVERFDLEPDRPILHGALGQLPVERLRELSTKEKVPIVLRIVDVDRVSADLGASLVEIGETIHTWPQLGSAVTLGAAVLTDTARRILLGDLTASGRFRVDLARIIADTTAESLPPAAPANLVSDSLETPRSPARPLLGEPSPAMRPLSGRPRRTGPVRREHAAMAFRHRPGRL